MSETETVTLYKLYLGDQDSTTGHYRRGYTIHSISIMKHPSSAAFSFTPLGKHSRKTETAYTLYSVEEGDVILDALGRYYECLSAEKWAPYNVVKFFVLTLEELAEFPFLSGFFGFEDEEHGTLGFGFEEGFERGTWAT